MQRLATGVLHLVCAAALAAAGISVLGASQAAAHSGLSKGPSKAERRLLDSVPSSFDRSCKPAKPISRSGSVAAIVCDDGSGNTLEYNQFRKVAALKAWYDGEVSSFNVPSPTQGHNPGDCPFNNDYTTNSRHKGHVLCLREGDGSAWYEWADQPTLIFATAIRKDGDAAQLDTFFQRAGPCLPRETDCTTQ